MTNEERIVLKEWHDRTEWVQKTALPHELGLHRADVLRLRIESRDKRIKELEAEIDQLKGPVVTYKRGFGPGDGELGSKE